MASRRRAGYTRLAMTLTDRYGLPVTTTSATAVDHFQQGMDAVLAYGPGAEQSFRGRPEGRRRARGGPRGCRSRRPGAGRRGPGPGGHRPRAGAAAGATRREQQHVEALGALVAGETARGLALVDEHVGEFPRDALLVNQASSAIGFAGRADREEYRMAFLERLAPAYGDDWWFQSALAFTYHEVDRYEESRSLSERSLAAVSRQRQRQPQPGPHPLRDARHRRRRRLPGRVDDGLRPARVVPLPSRLAPGHVRAAPRAYARAQEIFERDILPAVNPRLAMIDGAALLWRFRLDGQPTAPAPGGRSPIWPSASPGPASSSARSTRLLPTPPVATGPRSRNCWTASGPWAPRGIRLPARWRCRWPRGRRRSWPAITPRAGTPGAGRAGDAPGRG